MISIGLGELVDSKEVVAEGFSMIAYKYVSLDSLPLLTQKRKSRVSTLEELEKIFDDIASHPDASITREKLKENFNIQSLLTLNPLPLILEFENKLHIGDGSPESIEQLTHNLNSLAFLLLYQGGCKDFTLLHFLTSSVPLRILCKNHPKLSALLIRRWWIMVLSAYLFKGAPKCSLKHNTQIRPWDVILQDAFKHLDEHVVKAVIVCKEFYDDAPEKVKNVIPQIVNVVFTIPGPEKKTQENDWIYLEQESPWSTIQTPKFRLAQSKF